jgi:DNA end-binding protein Ku
VPGIGPVENSDIVKGYQVEPDVYVTLEPEEVEAIKLESKKTIDLVQFVNQSEIDARYFERPYYIVPKDEVAAEGYLVIREALMKEKKVGLAQITMHGREHLVAVMPIEKGMLLEAMRYPNELRASDKFFKDLDDLATATRCSWPNWSRKKPVARRSPFRRARRRNQATSSISWTR